jgi:hypothetical protein
VHGVGELYVDPQGMSGLYNQVRGVYHDAKAASEHIDKHADIPFYEGGIIFLVARTHSRARGLIQGTVDGAAARASALGTAINQCQVFYVESDAAARAQFDGAFPGPGSVAVGAVIDNMRPELPDSAVPFGDVAAPTAHLRTPEWAAETVRFQMHYVWDALSPSSWIRQISMWTLKHDPFEAWLKVLSGDWSGYYRCAVVWQQISACAYDLGTNLLRAAHDTPLVWRGNAATTTEAILVANAAVLDELAEAGLFYSDRYRDAAQAAIKCFDTVSALAGDLVDRLLLAGVAAAMGTATIETGIGALIGYSVAGYYAYQALKIVYEVQIAINTLSTVVTGLAGLMDAYEANLTWTRQAPPALTLPAVD